MLYETDTTTGEIKVIDGQLDEGDPEELYQERDLDQHEGWAFRMLSKKVGNIASKIIKVPGKISQAAHELIDGLGGLE